ncbi:MAG: ribonuclease HII [Patescibacteria group bacterium]
MSRTKPHKKEETALRQRGFQYIAGADEAGKGPWAGPIVAAAVILPSDFEPRQVNDSKQLTERQRQLMFVHVARTALSWAVGVVSSQEIDRRGIVAANKKALLTALKKLHLRPQAILVDAVKLKIGKKPVKAIIGGDAKVLSIAAASIVAKVVRDALMVGQHRLFPQYEFHRHKGYGTPRHQRLLKRYGPSPIHRRSFQPVRALINRRRRYDPVRGDEYLR